MASPDPKQRMHEHAAFLRAVARQLVRDPGAVDDVVQEALLRAAERDAQGLPAPRSWLATVARNLFRDRFAQERARRRREQEYVRRGQRGAQREVHGVEQLTCALAALPHDYRQALQLRFYMQHSFAAMAAELGVPVATAKTRVRRGLQLLRADLDQRLGGADEVRGVLLPMLLVPTSPGAMAFVPTQIAALVSVLTTLMTKKLVVAALAVASLFCLWLPQWWSTAARIPAGLEERVAASVSAAVHDLGAASSSSAPSRPDVVAANERHELVPPGWSRVRGRIVDAAMRQPVPFCGLRLQHDGAVEELCSDAAGNFASQRAWPPTATITVTEVVPSGASLQWPAVSLQSVLARAPTVPLALVDAADAVTMGVTLLDHGYTVQALPAVPNATSAATEPVVLDSSQVACVPGPTTAPRQQRLGDFASVLAIEFCVDCGPTYRLRSTLPAGVTPSEVQLGLARNPEGGIAWVRDYSESRATLQRVPQTADEYWCRFQNAPQVDARLPHALHAWTADGYCSAVVDVDYVWGSKERSWPLVWTGRGRVVGTAIDTFGAPLAEQWIELSNVGTGALSRSSERTDSEGRFAFDFVPEGSTKVHVTGETVQAWRETIEVRAGAVTTCALRIARRPIAGAIQGRIVTASGAQFPRCSVHLTSRNDTALWRTANIVWTLENGRQVGRFEFEAVPLMECNVQLNTFSPCHVATRLHAVAPPVEGLQFVIDDASPMRTVRFVVRNAQTGAPLPGCFLRLFSGGGWRTTDQLVGEDPIEMQLSTAAVAAGEAEWLVMGPNVALARGRVAPGQHEVAVEVSPGFSALLHCFDARNFHPVAGVPFLADGRVLGRTDARGDLIVDLPAAPRALSLGTAAWRMFSSQSLHAGVDPDTGTLRPVRDSSQITLYLLQVEDW